MSSSARLKYRIVKCTSEDPEYPASELLTHSSQTKGWQTARFCDFPQEIGLQFETPVHLRQVQFLSHQSKIATKIDLYTAMPAAGQASTYDALSFKRLGYLSLDSNERSQFQARELKSVYVDVSAQFMKILFHKCHVNRYNIVNQVGLIALNCLGEALGPDLAMGPPPPNPALARGPTNGYQPPQASSPPPPQPSVQDAAQAAADEMRYDAQTLERIRSLSNAKARAVDAEDYEEAKRCKEMLARLRQTGLLLRELEDRKKAAVQNEDYDAAKALKSEIDRLRSAIERPEVRAERPHSGRSARSNSLGPNSRAGAGSPDFASHHSAPRGGHQPQMVPLSQDSEAVMQAPPSRGKRSPSPSLPAFPLEEGYSQAEVPRREAANSPPLPAAGGARVARTPPLSGMASARSAPKELPPEQPPLSERGFDAADHPLSGVPNVEDLSQPEPLNSNFQKEAEPLIQLFGEYLANCVYSKAWSLRDAALQKLTLDLQNGEHQSTDQSRLLAGYVIVLKRMVPDKNVQVFLAAAALLHTVCQELLGRSGPRRAEAHSALDPLMPLLVDRLGDSNARVDKAARDAHLCDLMRCATVGATFTAQYLLRPPKKKSVNPRVYISRMQLLTSMVTEAGIQPESKEGLPLDPTVQLAMDWFNNANADVRESAVKLVAACYAHAGLRRIEQYLANLRQAQREIFDEEFDRVDAGDGLGAGGDDGLQQETARTQRTARTAGSNRSTPKGQGSRPGAIPEDAAVETEDVTKCQFCGAVNSEGTQEAMDVHYWRECPMLTQCQFCEQVIEIAQLASHWREECEARSAATEAAKDLAPNQCPLCRADIGTGKEQDWLQHILRDGCAGNPRKLPT